MKYFKVNFKGAPGYSVAAADESTDYIYRYSTSSKLWHYDKTLVEAYLVGDAFGEENLTLTPLTRSEAGAALAGAGKLDRRVRIQAKLIEDEERQIEEHPEQVLTTAEVGIPVKEAHLRPTTAPGLLPLLKASRSYRAIALYSPADRHTANALNNRTRTKLQRNTKMTETQDALRIEVR